jgi:hypothetical protein
MLPTSSGEKMEEAGFFETSVDITRLYVVTSQKRVSDLRILKFLDPRKRE